MKRGEHAPQFGDDFGQAQNGPVSIETHTPSLQGDGSQKFSVGG